MKILDPCCGSRMMYFDKQDQRVLFGDIRQEEHYLKDRDSVRYLEVKPDIKLDFTNLPFNDESFRLVVFDPPHLVRAGRKSWLAKKYGKLGEDWRNDIKKGIFRMFPRIGRRWSINLQMERKSNINQRNPIFD